MYAIAHTCQDTIRAVVLYHRMFSLQWRNNWHDRVSNHQPHDCLHNRLFRRRSKKTSKLRVTGLCAGNSPGTGEFPAQMASNAENVFIWWRHHVDLTVDNIISTLCWNGIYSPEQYLNLHRNGMSDLIIHQSDMSACSVLFNEGIPWVSLPQIVNYVIDSWLRKLLYRRLVI